MKGLYPMGARRTVESGTARGGGRSRNARRPAGTSRGGGGGRQPIIDA